MSWSRAEVLALAERAARGAGAPPGQAALFGQVAALHLAQGREAQMLAVALAALPDGPIVELALVLQEALAVAGDGGEIVFSWAGDLALARSYLETLPFACVLDTVAPGRISARFAARSAAAGPLSRISGCEALMDHMSALAANLLVPESAMSRSSGAGADLSDND